MSKETFTLGFRCSVKDKPFYIRFARENSQQKFRRDETIVPMFSYRDKSKNKPRNPYEVSDSDLSFNGFRCPHCYHDGSHKNFIFIRCGECQELVCGAKSTETTFECADSCGRKGVIRQGSCISSYEGRIETDIPRLTHNPQPGTSLIVTD